MNYRSILKTVGVMLVLFGLIDLALMIYCVVNGLGYSSSFNIFAIAAGVFLMRGSLRAAHVITVLCAFIMGAVIGVTLLILPFVLPIGLLVTQVKLYPGQSLLSWLAALLWLGLLVWTYRQLRKAPVLEASRAAGRRMARPYFTFGVGLAFAILMAALLHVTLHGAAASKAVALVRQQLGPGYKYATQSIQWGGGRGRAVAAAYNDHEIKYVPVRWDDQEP
ncbi:hypothetical protein [Pseudoxanthomonas sp. UC19_8]|uniref:hypothetical protein n=1 Tax=Pseudoxanthomonas sp. UC19_8 TaxID=3350175 RepID=UPI0036D31261